MTCCLRWFITIVLFLISITLNNLPGLGLQQESGDAIQIFSRDALSTSRQSVYGTMHASEAKSNTMVFFKSVSKMTDMNNSGKFLKRL